LGSPTRDNASTGEWAEIHQMWPGHFNTIGHCAAELLMIQSIFMVWFAGREQFLVERDIYQIWGEDRSVIGTIHISHTLYPDKSGPQNKLI